MRFKRRPKSKLENSRNTLISALRKWGLTDQARRLQLFAGWNEAVGERVAKVSEPHGFSRGTLTVRVKNASWQQELQFLKRELIEKVNAALGEDMVRDIRIIAGALQEPEPEEPFVLPKPTAHETAKARAVAEEIDDPEVRERFAQLMEKSARAQRS